MPINVSVVIPCYNQGSYIDEAVESVLAQTFQDFEIIIVNDGSTDEATNRLLAHYDKPGTRVVQTVNQGVALARNTGIKESCGEYILTLDADDKIGPTYLEKAVAAFQRHPGVGIVYCYGEMFGTRRGVIAAQEFSVRKMLLTNQIFSAALFRKDDWARTGGYNANMGHGCEDWDFWLSLLELGRTASRIPEVLFYYRIKEISRNAAMDREKRIDMHMQMIRNHRDLYIDHLGPLVRLYYRVTDSWWYRGVKRARGLLASAMAGRRP